MATDHNFVIKNGLTVGDNEIITVDGNITLPANATIEVGGVPFESGGVDLTAFSVGADATASGSGGIAYDNTSGVFTYTPPDLSSLGVDYIDFATGLESEDVAHSPGRVYYNDEYKALTVYNDEADLSLRLGFKELVRVYNNSGSTIATGTPCRPTGAFGESQTIAPADATTYAKARVLGVATHSIEDSSYGYLAVRGLVSGVDTSGLTAGGPVWLAADGSLQSSAPTYPYFPTQVGGCIVSDAAAGYLYVSPTYLTQAQARVTGNQHVDGNVVIDGDLVVNGTQSTVSQNNLQVSDSFIYLNSGDNIGEAGTTFTGTGLDDAYFAGYYEGPTVQTYYVRIDGVGTGTGGVDTFEWSYDNFSTTEATGVDITGDFQELAFDVGIRFNAATGHTSGDTWSGTASPINIDTGWATNRNTGATGVGYTHMGVFFDVSDNKFKFFDEYAPEPSGTIDTADASFSLGTIVADTFEGTLTGSASNNVLKSGDTMTGDLSFGDNVKANFGAGSNLRIFYNGAHSVIQDNGDGNLYLQGSSSVNITNVGGSETYASFNENGASTIYYDNAPKLATTSTGIDVTGTVTTDDAVIIDGAQPYLRLNDTDGPYQSNIMQAGPHLYIDNDSTGVIRMRTGTNTERLVVGANGDIYFNEDTGVIPKFYWDASAENLGIGTSNPNAQLDISNATEAYFRLTHTGSNYWQISNDSNLKFNRGGTERMRIDSSGNLLVGMSSSSSSSTGVRALQDGFLSATRDGSAGATAAFNRNTSDGDIVVFRKDGAQVGSIGTSSARMYLGTSDTGLIFSSFDYVRPWNPSTNSSRDDAIYLGGPSDRFKGLYLSGRLTNDGDGGLSVTPEGDVNFYEDTGVTAKMVWDASDESLSIGDVAGDSVSLRYTSNAPRVVFNNGGVNNANIVYRTLGSPINPNTLEIGTISSGTVELRTNNTPRLTIDANGNVGIGTSNPDAPLTVVGDVRIGDGNPGDLKLRGNVTPAVTVGGSTLASVISNYGVSNGGYHVGIEVPSNDVEDGFYVATDSNQDGVVDTLAMKIKSNGYVGIGTNSPSYKLEVNGSFAATTKSFVIDHPTKEGMKLRHGSLEGPEDGVYVRGKLDGNNVIELPDYWTGLVHEDTITVQLTAIGSQQDLYIEDIVDNKIHIAGADSIKCFYFVQAERKDVDRWDIEYEA